MGGGCSPASGPSGDRQSPLLWPESTVYVNEVLGTVSGALTFLPGVSFLLFAEMTVNFSRPA